MWLASKIPADPARCFWLRKAAMELITIKFRFTKLEKGKSPPRANRWTCRDQSPNFGRRRPGDKQHWSFTIPRQETMKRPYWALLALSSFVICTLTSATRPRFGGALTVDLTPTWTTLAPSEIEMLAPLIVETLVRINERGEPEPLLAVNWQHDADRKRWRFSLKPKVTFHDGEPLSATAAAPALLAALKKRYGDVKVTAGGDDPLHHH